MKKMQLEGENNKLRRELNLMEETKQNLEKQNRMFDHEVSFKEAGHECEPKNFLFLASKVRKRTQKSRSNSKI